MAFGDLGGVIRTVEHLASEEDGLVARSRAMRETRQEVMLDIVNRLRSTLHDLRFTDREAVGPGERRDVRAREGAGEEVPQPRHTRISRSIIEKYRTSGGCPKCRAVRARDVARETVGHSDGCRRRIEDLTQKDPELRERDQQADKRRLRFMAENIAPNIDEPPLNVVLQLHTRGEEMGIPSALGRARGTRTRLMLARPLWRWAGRAHPAQEHPWRVERRGRPLRRRAPARPTHPRGAHVRELKKESQRDRSLG